MGNRVRNRFRGAGDPAAYGSEEIVDGDGKERVRTRFQRPIQDLARQLDCPLTVGYADNLDDDRLHVLAYHGGIGWVLFHVDHLSKDVYQGTVVFQRKHPVERPVRKRDNVIFTILDNFI